jgi:small subunit ribosomal protein S20
MPLIKSAKKALRVSIRRKKENDLTRSKIKSAVKGARFAVAKNEKDISDKLNILYRELDMAVKKHLIHKNKAARLKSRISKKASSPVENKPVVKRVKKTAK